jgi:hypothetical protein
VVSDFAVGDFEPGDEGFIYRLGKEGIAYCAVAQALRENAM